MDKEEFMRLGKEEKLGFLSERKKDLQRLREKINQEINRLGSEL